MMEQLSNISLWALMLGVFWGIFFLFIYKQVDYIRHFGLTALYFFGVALATSLVFWGHLASVLANVAVLPLVVFFVVALGHVALYFYLPRYLPEPTAYLKQYPRRTFLTLDHRRLVSKAADLLAQQVFVVLLALFLRDAGLTLLQIVIAFAVIFGGVHLPLIIIDQGAWPAWYFAGFAVLSGIVFPVLVLKIAYGFVYSYIVHWLFYTLTAVGFWVWYARRGKVVNGTDA